jgi:hypothetical protein
MAPSRCSGKLGGVSRGVQAMKAKNRLATGWLEGHFCIHAAFIAFHIYKLCGFALTRRAHNNPAAATPPGFVDQSFDAEELLLACREHK